MIELSRIAGMPDPVYIDNRHSFTVRLSRFIHSTASRITPEERIVALLAEFGPLSLSEMMGMLGWSGTPRHFQVLLNRLRIEGAVEIVGKNRWARWKLSSPVKA